MPSPEHLALHRLLSSALELADESGEAMIAIRIAEALDLASELCCRRVLAQPDHRAARRRTLSTLIDCSGL
jgi:hypothetical protein